jgi:RNA polymerase sigma-70 factor, ECF subfamily
VPSEFDEPAVLRQAQQGDQQAYGLLVARYEQICFRAAYLVVRDEMEAQDVSQEAFVRAYKALGRFDLRQPFKPWLLRIATNLALNSVRSSKRRSAIAEKVEREAAHVAPSPERDAVASDEARRVWAAVASLPQRDQELIYLRYFLDSSEQELAQAIGRPRGTVKSRLHRSLARLRAVIERDYPDLAPERQSGLVEKTS